MPLNETQKKQLQDLIDVLSACGAPKDMLQQRIRKITLGMGLDKNSVGDVKKAFTAAGFNVLNTAGGVSIVTLLPPQSNTTGFEKPRNDLHQYMKDKGRLDPKSKVMQQVDDIYDFLAAYSADNLDAAETHRNEPNLNVLISGFNKIRDDCSGPKANQYPYRHYLEMAQSALKLLGNPGDGSREKYSKYVALEQLKKKYAFLTKLAGIPDSIKLEKWFAEECISKLQLKFNREEAIAIYNGLAELKEEPYEEESTDVVAVCPNCGNTHTFKTLADAQKAKCTCGTPLYRQCPKCKKFWPAAADYCGTPGCGMNLNAVRNFDAHYQNAENALRANNPVKARAEYNAAELCNPTETARLKALNTKIVDLEERLGRPIREIESLINSKLMNAASAKIAVASRQLPGVDLSTYAKEVNAALQWAREQNAKLSKITQSTERVKLCLQIQQRVADDTFAAEELRKNRPLAVVGLQAVTTRAERNCVLSWDPNPQNINVTYTLVRKENTAPLNTNDGTVLAEKITTTNFKDTNLKPGVNYFYSVFAVRGDTESPNYSNTMPVIFFQELDSFEASAVDEKCMIAWKNVPGSAGVRILRDGKIISALVTNGSYVDDDVSDGDEYKYTLQTVWKVGSLTRYSTGVSKFVTIESRPDPLVISSSVKNGMCEIKWAKPAKQRTVTLVSLKPGQKVLPGAVHAARDMSSVGEVLRNVPSAQGGCSWPLGPNSHLNIVAYVNFASSVIASNTVSVSNVPGCEIDTAKTHVQSGELKLVVKSVPAGAKRIAYSIRTDRFATEDEISRLPTVESSKWQLIHHKTAGQDLYVSLFTQYGDGSSVYYSPASNMLVSAAGKIAIEYDVIWKSGWGGKRRSGAKLKVIAREGKRLPGMTLYASSSGKTIVGNLVTDLVALCRVEPQNSSSAVLPLDDSAIALIPADTAVKLILDANEEQKYTLPEAKDYNNLLVPRK